MLDAALAARFADIALGHVTRDYPHKLDHTFAGPEDVQGPRALHPIFFGSYDWHSCVHGYWLLLRVRRAFPAMPANARIEALVDAMITPEAVEGERAYLDRPGSAGFERPYGWAWALALHAEAARSDRPDWATRLDPLARAFAARLAGHLPKLTYPIRVGTHYNTAFALILAHDWAATHHAPLAALIADRARGWFGADRDCQAWEPGGDEFLSPALCEAMCMAKMLDPAEFRAWFAAFLPRFGAHAPASLFTPATVSDRSDGKIAHLDGCNLSRAWCLNGIAGLLDPALADVARASADRHLAASLPHLADDYMGAHWLATFAMLAVAGEGR
ncbi:MAG: hypothetical protein B7Y45_00505 [Sphingomonas sp. 28-66-16]|nr:MAG: hypothetical protein B7Y45_00505 [Sphingomonas sp. 28-66-16]